MAEPYTYLGRAVRVVDGDTIDVEMSLGFHLRALMRLRLLGVDCPERQGATREAGALASLYTATWVAETDPAHADWPLLVTTHKSDVFGRFLARVERCSDGRCLNDDLVADGHAVPFDGHRA